MNSASSNHTWRSGPENFKLLPDILQLYESTLTSIIPPEARYVSQELPSSSPQPWRPPTPEMTDTPYFHVRDLAVKLLRHPTLHLNGDDLATNSIEVVAMD